MDEANVPDEVVVLTDWSTNQNVYINERIISILPNNKYTSVKTLSGNTLSVTETADEVARLAWPGKKGKTGL